MDRINYLEYKDKFHIIHDGVDERILYEASKILNESYQKSKSLGVFVSSFPFFIFSNHNRFEQNNVVSVDEGTGGVTEAFKNRLLVYNNGSLKWLRHVIMHEFGHEFEFEILYGGFFRSGRLLKSVFYPLWLMEGFAEWMAGDVDEEFTNLILRDLAMTGNWLELKDLFGFAHLKPHMVTPAYKTGYAAVKYLEIKYGSSTLKNVFADFRDKFDVDSVLMTVYGINLSTLSHEVKEYYTKYYQNERDTKKLLYPDEYGEIITQFDSIPVFNESQVVSQDGIYYFTDKMGKTAVVFKGNKEKVLLEEKTKAIDVIATDRLSISPGSKKLAFIVEKNRLDLLAIYDIESGKLKLFKTGISFMRHPSFIDEENIVFDGLERGISNIYLYNTRSKTLYKLTDSFFDKSWPVYYNNKIYYSREVIINGRYERDIFYVDLSTPLIENHFLNFPGSETDLFIYQNKIYFTGDYENRYEIYSCELDTGKVLRHTNSLAGNFHPFLYDGKLYATVYFKQSKNIYRINPADYDVNFTTHEIISELKHGEVHSKPAVKKFSTDFYFPFIVYSTQEGLLFAHAWLFSDVLSENRFQNLINYQSAGSYLQYLFNYTYSRYRPDINISFEGIRGYETSKNYKTFDRQLLSLTYPLTRLTAIDFGVSNLFETSSLNQKFSRNTSIFFQFGTGNLTGRYLNITQGHSLLFFVEKSVYGSNDDFINFFVEGRDYTPLGGNSTLVKRIFYFSSAGTNPFLFNSNGFGRARGFNSLQLTRHAIIFNTELRFPLKHFEYSTSFLFPDFYFKGVYLGLFLDSAVVWNDEKDFELLKNNLKLNDMNLSYGVALRLPVFLLQSFYMNLTFEWAKNFYHDNLEFYFSIYPAFIKNLVK